jgi:hypothetical protein
MKFCTNVVLSLADADWLDEQARIIRKTSGAHISRSAFLRGLVNGIQTSGLDLSRSRSEQDIAGCISFLIKVVIERPTPAVEVSRTAMEQNGRQRP